MLVGRTTGHPEGCIILLLMAAGLPAAQPATLVTRNCAVTISSGVVVGLSNRLSGEMLVPAVGQEAGLSALNRLNESESRVEQATLLTHSNRAGGIEWLAEWESPSQGVTGQMRTRFSTEPRTDDILVEQEGRLPANGLVGVSAFDRTPLSALVRTTTQQKQEPAQKVDATSDSSY